MNAIAGNYHVAIAAPPDYAHSASLLETAEAILYGLRDLGLDTTLSLDLEAPGRRSIILGANLLSLMPTPAPADAILFNLEQVDPNSVWVNPDYLELLRRHEIWDYSARNIALLRAQGVQRIRHVPIGYAASLTRIKPADNPDIDVLFYGTLNERRQRILDALAQRGARVHCAVGVYGAERDALIARSHIVLNLHFYESKIFEVTRVSYLLANGVCVVSETGNDPMEQEYVDGVAFAAYDDLVDTCLALLADPVRRRDLAARGLQLMQTKPQSVFLRAVLAEDQPQQSAPATAHALTPQLAIDQVVAAVPATARRLLLASDDDRLATALAAAGHAVFTAEGDGPFDCIVYGDALSCVADPWALLRRHRDLLAPGGCFVAATFNVQHLSVLRHLLSGDFPYGAGGIDPRHQRHFTYGAFIKMAMDAGFAPQQLAHLSTSEDPVLLEAALPLARALGVNDDTTRRNLTALWQVWRGLPLGWDEQAVERPLTFVVCVNNEAQLAANLLASPCLQAGSLHEVILMRGAGSAAEGLNRGLEQAKNGIVVFLHQDVYLPRGWPARFVAQLEQAEASVGPVGIAGVFGVSADGNGGKRESGHVVDRNVLRCLPPLPARVDTLDELLLAVPKSTPLRFDPALGWHLYASDFALQARQAGLAAAVVDAPCVHHSFSGYTLSDAYWHAGEVFRAKWRDALPVFTPCADFHPEAG